VNVGVESARAKCGVVVVEGEFGTDSDGCVDDDCDKESFLNFCGG